MDRSRRAAVEVHAATLTKRVFSVAADCFVLAAGGIENARIMLVSRCGGGDRGTETRTIWSAATSSITYLHVPIGLMWPRDGTTESPHCLHTRDGVQLRGGLSLTEECRRAQRGLGFAATFHDAEDRNYLRPASRRRTGATRRCTHSCTR